MPCWSLQCDKCKEYYLGTPTQGHQCYRQMSVDTEYCLDPDTQEKCNQKPMPLHPHRPVFFAIQPKFMNVDIRLLVDIAQGGVDLFFAPRDDMFVVRYDERLQGHRVELDPKYIITLGFDQGGQPLFQPPNTSMPLERLVNATDGYASLPYQIIEKTAAGLTTFLTVARNSIVVVRRLQNRLVLTLPQDEHDLRSTRFYILVQGVGRQGVLTAAVPSSEVTFGSLFFRQDQPRIDLFVFFSVFFSCFFLFLAVSVVAWKAKQAIEGRRARQRQVVEMMHMARRPFASVSVFLEAVHRPPPPSALASSEAKRTLATSNVLHAPASLTSQLCSPLRWKRRQTRVDHSVIAAAANRNSGGENAMRVDSLLHLPRQPHLLHHQQQQHHHHHHHQQHRHQLQQQQQQAHQQQLQHLHHLTAVRVPDIRPVAVEPTADGIAAIATLVVHLPGARLARTQLALASALVLPPRSRTNHLTTEF